MLHRKVARLAFLFSGKSFPRLPKVAAHLECGTGRDKAVLTLLLLFVKSDRFFFSVDDAKSKIPV